MERQEKRFTRSPFWTGNRGEEKSRRILVTHKKFCNQSSMQREEKGINHR